MPIRNKSVEDDDDILVQGDTYEQDSDDDNDIDPKEDVVSLDKKKMAVIVAGVLVVIGIIILVVVNILTKGSADKVPIEQQNGSASKFEDEMTEGTTSDTTDIDAILNQAGISTGETATTGVYTETDLASLRGAGFTADQIEKYGVEGKTVDELLLKSKVDKDRFLQERYKELDTEARTIESSSAYQELKNYTWLGGEPQTITYDDTESYTTESVTYNARYDRIPLRGNECLVKLYLDEDKGLAPAFYNVHPEKYAKLKDTGNMVVTFDVVTYNGAKYVCNINELNIN